LSGGLRAEAARRRRFSGPSSRHARPRLALRPIRFPCATGHRGGWHPCGAPGQAAFRRSGTAPRRKRPGSPATPGARRRAIRGRPRGCQCCPAPGRPPEPFRGPGLTATAPGASPLWRRGARRRFQSRRPAVFRSDGRGRSGRHCPPPGRGCARGRSGPCGRAVHPAAAPPGARRLRGRRRAPVRGTRPLFPFASRPIAGWR